MTDDSLRIFSRLHELSSRLDAQSLEIVTMRDELYVQFRRIAALQAELDILAAAKRRHTARAATVTLGPRAVDRR
jgi:hypothetical protein